MICGLQVRNRDLGDARNVRRDRNGAEVDANLWPIEFNTVHKPTKHERIDKAKQGRATQFDPSLRNVDRAATLSRRQNG